MDNDFLKKLQEAVNEGEFNSDAAKKINEINDLADKKIKTTSSESELENLVNKRIDDAGRKRVDEEDIVEINSEYEKRFEQLKKEDERNKDIASLLTLSQEIDTILEKIKEFEEKYSTDNEIIKLISDVKEFKINFYK
ncbi:MAG: hypothetical protein ACOC33_01175 [bacterium]